jgi:hypothetical protein
MVFVGSGVTVAVRDGVGVTVFVGRGVLVGTANSICNRGAPAGAPSNALAVRWPVPPIMMTKEFPADHPGRFTTSWMIVAIFGVRWSTPA